MSNNSEKGKPIKKSSNLDWFTDVEPEYYSTKKDPFKKSSGFDWFNIVIIAVVLYGLYFILTFSDLKFIFMSTFNNQNITYNKFNTQYNFEILVFIVCTVVPLLWKPSRKAIGLMNIIIGSIVSLSGIGALIGIPMIIFGGILLFL